MSFPINLSTRAESLRGHAAGLAQRVLTRPGLHCDQFDAAGLQHEDSGKATQDELCIIVAGQGALRCANDSLMEVTAGEVLYAGKGTMRRFENLSRKFLMLRLSLSPECEKPPTDTDGNIR